MSKSFRTCAKNWCDRHQLHGPSAFMRYVMMVFVECLCKESSDFTFKGGNLLWLYIQTPRSTIDVDFITLSLQDHGAVRLILENACKNAPAGIEFQIIAFREISHANQKSASVVVKYKTSEGGENKFSVDIVYAVPTSVLKILSPIGDQEISVASVENIIADKLAACHRFKGGNTRMKDFDDLWRLSKSSVDIDRIKLREHLDRKKIPQILVTDWVDDSLQNIWSHHAKKYKDLPISLRNTI